MKRNISLFMIGIICAFSLITFSSCGFLNPIERFKYNLSKADSYQITIYFSGIPNYTTIKITSKIDGNVQYISESPLSKEMYIETIDDIRYKYAKDGYGKWRIGVMSSDDDLSYSDIEKVEELFDSNNYKKVITEEGLYIQKPDVSFEDFKDVMISITNESFTIDMITPMEIHNIVGSYKLDVKVKIIISDLNQIEVKLPKVN